MKIVFGLKFIAKMSELGELDMVNILLFVGGAWFISITEVFSYCLV